MVMSASARSALLDALIRELDKTRPGAAGSLREGLDETLTGYRRRAYRADRSSWQAVPSIWSRSPE